MYCDKCKKEFDTNESNCPDCGEAMSACKLPSLDEIDQSRLIRLCEVTDDFEADVKLSLLRSCGIVAFKRYGVFSDVAKVYCGNSNLGVEICVLDSDRAEAEAIINAPFDEADFDKQAYGEDK